MRSGLGYEGPEKGGQPGLWHMGLAGSQGRGVPRMEEGGVPELRSHPNPGQESQEARPRTESESQGAYVLAPRHLAMFLQNQCLWERKLKRDPTVHL